MGYNVHNFRSGDKLMAAQLNDMDSQIAANEKQINAYTQPVDLTGMVELGTAYVAGTGIEHESATDCVRVKRGSFAYLYAGTTIKPKQTGFEVRILRRTNFGYEALTNFITTHYVLDKSGEYVLVFRNTAKIFTTPDSILAYFEIARVVGNVGENAVDEANEIRRLNSIVGMTPLTPDQFEFGTAYVYQGHAEYENSAAVIRIKRGTTLHVKKNYKLHHEGFESRILKVDNGTWTQLRGFSSADYLFREECDCLIVLQKISTTAITSIKSVTDNVTLCETKMQPDNTAKGVFCIMSYNVGSFYNGSGNVTPDSLNPMYERLNRGIFDRYMPDVACLQEYRNKISSKKFADDMLADYFVDGVNTYATTQYDGKGIYSRNLLESSQSVDFASTEGELRRNYLKAYIYLNGRKICFISAHMCTGNAAARSNAQELIAAVVNEDYAIICADTNLEQSDAADREIVGLFTAAGLQVLNADSIITYPSENFALDKIITKGGITVKSVFADHQKDGAIPDADRDHYPLVAYLEIY